MTLRLRLSLAFALVVMVPLVVGAALVGRGVPRALDDATRNQLATARASTLALLQHECESAALSAEVIGREAAVGGAADAVREIIGRGLIRYAVVSDGSGRVLARAGGLSDGTRPTPDQLGSCTGTRPAGVDVAAVTDVVTVTSRQGAVLARAAVAIPYGDVLRRLVQASSADVLLVRDGRVVGSSARPGVATSLVDRAVAHPGQTVVQGQRIAVAGLAGGGLPTVVVAGKRASVVPLEELIGVVVVGALLLAGLMGWQLARVTTQPLVELADAAARVAGGDLGTQISVRSHDEVGRLAIAFNEMTDELRTYIGELESSRDELRRSLGRLGDTLSSTHDLGGILAVVLETAMVSTRARAGAIFLATLGRDELYLKVARGLDDRALPAGTRIRFGAGVTGEVALTGEAVHGRVGHAPGELALGPGEPAVGCLISAPLKSSGHVIGVLDLYDRVDADAFDQDDVDTIRSFASQASVAIDNVLLHQEAQRLSITDGLTGLWNYRYFQMTLGKEVERAARFDRPLAMLMLDLDHFKRVNDEHGHQRGDSVLVEFARRVKSQVREVDVLARYGGEELACVLPETDRTGAEHTASRICQAVRATLFDGPQPLAVTVSVGVAVFPEHGRTPDDLIHAADEALYVAKNAGRNQWRTATSAVLPPPQALP